MKIGMIFECGPQGADKQVCEYLARSIVPTATVESRTLDNKANLLEEAGKVAAVLLSDGCDRVLIVWDLRPAWPDKKHRPCRKEERDAILKSVKDAGVPRNAPVYLVCIEQELESWIIADEAKVSDFLSTSAHRYSARRERHPDRVQNPKAVLMNHFKQAKGQRYDDKVHALKILRKGELDLAKLRRSVSFARFESKLM